MGSIFYRRKCIATKPLFLIFQSRSIQCEATFLQGKQFLSVSFSLTQSFNPVYNFKMIYIRKRVGDFHGKMRFDRKVSRSEKNKYLRFEINPTKRVWLYVTSTVKILWRLNQTKTFTKAFLVLQKMLNFTSKDLYKHYPIILSCTTIPQTLEI